MTTPFPFFHAKVNVGDTAAPITKLTKMPVKLFNLDIQVQDNAVDFGDRQGQNLQLSVGDIYSNPFPTKPMDLQDIWVVNHSVGSTGVIVVTGLISNDN